MITLERLIEIKKKEMNKIAIKIIENDYEVMDNHNNKPLCCKPIGLAMKASGEIGLLIECSTIYCLNWVYVKDDIVYLSQTSIGNNIDGTKGLNIEEYNNSCLFNGGHIIETKYFKDMHIGMFTSQEDFDKFFDNINAEFVL